MEMKVVGYDWNSIIRIVNKVKSNFFRKCEWIIFFLKLNDVRLKEEEMVKF